MVDACPRGGPSWATPAPPPPTGTPPCFMLSRCQRTFRFGISTTRLLRQQTRMSASAAMRPSYVDTHTHLDQIFAKLGQDLSSFSEWKEESLTPQGFEACVQVCCDGVLDSTKHLIDTHPCVYAAFGMHPHNAKAYTDALEESFTELMSHEKVRAWGEIGLDYHYDISPRDVQKRVFRRQLEQAVNVGKPVVVHTREAEEDTLEIMKSALPVDWKIHVHCFTSSLDLAKALIDHFPNAFIGFTGVITFKSASSVRDVVRAVPMDRILLETDGPYMAPVPFRGKVCHSGHIPHIATKIAEVKDLSVEEVFDAARSNTKAMYGI